MVKLRVKDAAGGGWVAAVEREGEVGHAEPGQMQTQEQAGA